MGLARAISARNGRCAIGRVATLDGRQIGLLWQREAQRHDDHAVVGQRGPGAGDRHFLAAASAGGGENAAQLVDQGTLGPQAACLVQEGAHLAGHIAKAGGHAKQNRVVVGQLGRACYVGCLIGLATRVLENVFRHGLWHTLDGDFCAADAACTFGHGIGHGFDVTVHGIVENKYFCH